MSPRRPLVNKIDFWVIGGLLFAAILFSVWQRRWAAGGLEAVIYVGGAPVRVVDLSKVEMQAFTVEACPAMTFTIYDGAVAVTASDCPDQVCVYTGWLRHHGQTAACLPNGVLLQVRAKGRAAPDVDIVIGAAR